MCTYATCIIYMYFYSSLYFNYVHSSVQGQLILSKPGVNPQNFQLEVP